MDTPVLWAIAGFIIYFSYARCIRTVGWNVIELLISQHLTRYGVYATSLDYPSALTWRPVVGTAVVTFLRFFSDDPLRIYQLFCGIALSTLTAFLFLSARRIAGRFAAHITAGLVLSCPAITVYLVNHIHSYSHWAAMLTLGPAIWLSVSLLHRPEGAGAASTTTYLLTGIAWGLAYLSRSEITFFVIVFGAALGWLHWTRKFPWARAIATGVVFSVFFGAYTICAEHVSRRDGTLIRKSIYGFYISQGWVDAPPDVGPDVEADGYVYAVKLYGDPIANGESALSAIRRHPDLFARRVRINFVHFYQKYADSEFFPLVWSLAVAGCLLLILFGFVPRPDRIVLCFLLGLFFASHFVLAFHIDARYLTIAIPPLLLAIAYFCHHVVNRLAARSRLLANVGGALLIGVLLFSAGPNWRRIVQRPAPNEEGPRAMRALGEQFIALAGRDHDLINREPHVEFLFPENCSLPAEDQYLLAYFCGTAWMAGGAEGPFPRGKFYAYRDCREDFMFLPTSRLTSPAATGGRRIVGDFNNPILGRYTLLKTVKAH